MIETITEVFNQIKGFVTSADFQAFLTATIGIVTSVALLQNRLAALKVAKSDNSILKQNVEISSLEKMIQKQEEVIKTLHSKMDLQSAMFSLAFLNSKKLDSHTKQELAKLATGLQSQKIEHLEEKPVFMRVIEAAKAVAESPIVEKVEEATSIFNKLTKL
jgi:hypothetical protein